MRNVRDYDPPKDYHCVATVGEAHSTSASMKGACESARVWVMLGNVALLLHFYLTAKMEDCIAKLKQFSKLDFQSKREVINNRRPMPELKDMLQTTGQKITRSTSHIQSQIALKMFGTSRINLVLDLQRRPSGGLCNFLRVHIHECIITHINTSSSQASSCQLYVATLPMCV